MPTFKHAGASATKGSNNNNTAFFTGNIAVGDLIVAIGLSTTETITYTVSDGANTYTFHNNALFVNNVQTFYTVATTARTTGQGVRFDLSGFASISIAAYYCFSPSPGFSFTSVSPSSTPGQDETSSTTTAISMTTPYTLPTSCVMVGALMVRGPNGDAWTEDTSPTTFSSGKSSNGPSITQGTTGGGATTNMSLRAQWYIPSAGGSNVTWNPTLGTARDSVGMLSTYYETSGGGGGTVVDPMGMFGIFGI